MYYVYYWTQYIIGVAAWGPQTSYRWETTGWISAPQACGVVASTPGSYFYVFDGNGGVVGGGIARGGQLIGAMNCGATS